MGATLGPAIDPDAPLLSAFADGVLTLTLNRPQRRNALDMSLVEAMHSALDRFLQDPDQHVLVITGAAPAFCAGLDLADFARPEARRDRAVALITRLPTLRKPTIAAVNGAAITGGLEIALGCDLILASDSARFADTHLRLGTISGSGMAARLMRAIGPSWTRQMMLSAEPIDAQTALRIGLINEMLAPDALAARAHSIAASIARHDPALTATMKALLANGSLGTMADLLSHEAEALAARKNTQGAGQWVEHR